MIFKRINGFIGVLILIIFGSCGSIDDVGIYDQKLVVFGNLKANNFLTDTIFVSWSYRIEDNFEENQKWVADAMVTISDGNTTINLEPVANRPGRYVDPIAQYKVIPNTTYNLDIRLNNIHLTAQTTVPDTLHLQSVSSSDWECDGRPVFVDTINFYEQENTESKILQALWTNDFSRIVMDTVVYKEGKCYTTSFASVPMFIIKWEAESDPGFMRLISNALEDDHENAIVDTSLSAHIFKGHMLMDSLGLYYGKNPIIWNLNQKLLDFGWLSFNYYGPHMIEIQVADQSFQDYYRGFPMGMPQNQYILPNGNVEGGYGLFSSTYSKIFFIYVKPEE